MHYTIVENYIFIMPVQTMKYNKEFLNKYHVYNSIKYNKYWYSGVFGLFPFFFINGNINLCKWVQFYFESVRISNWDVSM